MQTFNEARHSGEFIISELDGHGSRDNVLIAVSQTIVPGAILGAADVVADVTSSAAADAGNTGNGVFTLDAVAPVGAGAQDGKYRVICIAVAANGGEFIVNDPQGVEIGKVAVGATFNNQIKFVIADGATDFVAGDAFTVTVGVDIAGQQFSALNPAANDGTQNAAAIAIYAATTDNATTVQIAAITRMSEVNAQTLTWPNGITAQQKAEAIVQLRKKGISVR
jgi:hypothetical protein